MIQSKIAWRFFAPCLIILMIISLYPTIFLIYYSLTDYVPFRETINFIGLRNYLNIFKDLNFYNSVKITIF